MRNAEKIAFKHHPHALFPNLTLAKGQLKFRI